MFEGTTRNSAVYMKQSRLGNIGFPVLAAGTRVIQDSGSQIANPTSTKQTISNSTRLIVLATNPRTKRYWHAYLQIIPCIRGTGGNNLLVGTRGNDKLCGAATIVSWAAGVGTRSTPVMHTATSCWAEKAATGRASTRVTFAARSR